MKTFGCAITIGAAFAAASEVSASTGLATAERAFLQRNHHRHHGRHPEAKSSAEIFEEVDKSLASIMQNGDALEINDYVEKLGTVEASLGSFANEDLFARVGKMRLTLCAEVGFQKHEADQCESFMGVACSMEGSGSGRDVSAEKCKQYFMESKENGSSGESTKAEAAEDEKKAEVAVAETVAAEKTSAGGDEAATNATNASGSELFGGKKYRALPEQGYNEYEDGVMVEHKNIVSHTGDWLSERDGRSKEEICKEFPDNQWCRMHAPRPRMQKRSHSEDIPPPPAEPVAEKEAPKPVEPKAEPKSDASRSFGNKIIISAAAMLFVIWAA